MTVRFVVNALAVIGFSPMAMMMMMPPTIMMPSATVMAPTVHLDD